MKSFVVIVLLVTYTKIKIITSTSSIESRIVNGKVAKEKQFPYQVGLRSFREKNANWCGGTLISNQWILTAGHCMKAANSVSVFLGALNRNDPKEKNQKIICVKKENFFIHENYEEKKYLNDIALVKLPSPVELNEYIKTAKLPKKTDNHDYSGKKAIASGWGQTNADKGKKPPDVLLWVEVPILRSSKCLKFFKGKPTRLCMDTKGTKSICFGDSGGPLVLADGSNTVVGISSLVYGCESKKPAAFTNVAHFLDWIAKLTGVVNK